MIDTERAYQEISRHFVVACSVRDADVILALLELGLEASATSWKLVRCENEIDQSLGVYAYMHFEAAE